MRRFSLIISGLLVCCILLGIMLWLGWRNVDLSTDDKETDIQRSLLQTEEKYIHEQAEWFGKTGLGDEIERELPRYLRQEFGEMSGDAQALRASDLHYIGVFDQSGIQTHFWHIRPDHRTGEDIFAYIDIVDSDFRMGWGDRKPPQSAQMQNPSV